MILDGQRVAKEWKLSLKAKIEAMVSQNERVPHLVVVIVGHDEASSIYVKSKQKQAELIGMKSTVIAFDENICETELLQCIDQLNQDDEVDGILVQLPLPKTINTQLVVEQIDPIKDVDGLTSKNVGKLFTDQDCHVACTPSGIMYLLDAYHIELEGKNALVIGRSSLVGMPIARLLLNRNATVTQAHSKTKNLKELIGAADIVVVAVGRKEMIPSIWLNESQVVVDVGIHRDEQGLVGDVQRNTNHVAFITPVPKGVGPMTIAALLSNTHKREKTQINRIRNEKG